MHRAMIPEWLTAGRQIKIVDPAHPWFGGKGFVTEIDSRLPLPVRFELWPGQYAYRSAPAGWGGNARVAAIKLLGRPLVDVPKPTVYCTAGHRMTASHPSYMRQVALNQCPALVDGHSHSHAREKRPCGRIFAKGYA